jgi:hypothetical protein
MDTVNTGLISTSDMVATLSSQTPQKPLQDRTECRHRLPRQPPQERTQHAPGLPSVAEATDCPILGLGSVQKRVLGKFPNTRLLLEIDAAAGGTAAPRRPARS